MSMENLNPVLREAAVRVFGEELLAMRWLSTPVLSLGGRRLADVELNEALALLAQLDHGFSA